MDSSSHELIAFFEGAEPLFEKSCRSNGMTYWSARELAEMLGYSDFANFRNAINKAQSVCISLDISVSEHFRQEEWVDETGAKTVDIKLSRFACYLAVMNSDSRKIQVAKAQAYFATFADACRRYIQESTEHERVLIRDQISQHESSLSSTARKSGVENYQLFQNAGYRGLYNMNLHQLRELKGVPSHRSPLDFMGGNELAANLFRITQTDEKIRREGIQGQRNLEKAASMVGKEVRATMQKLSGTKPEELAPAEDIRKIRTGIKSTAKGLNKIDQAKSKKRTQ